MLGIKNTYEAADVAERREETSRFIERIYREESRSVLATLIRVLGDFDLAEDALQEAFRTALEKWPAEGVPGNPRSWLISAGKFRALDTIRRRSRFEDAQHAITEQLYSIPAEPLINDDQEIEDDRLRLIFTCCHPALAPEARAAMTLREVCGLRTEEIARAFLTEAPTVAQRIVRAKSKIKDARIPYRVPTAEELPERLGPVLQVVYLVFNEGYSASAGKSLTRADLSEEAIRLGRLLFRLLPKPEVIGLLALMLLQESRRAARTSADGDIILLQDQDRSLWNRDQIAEGLRLVRRALRSGRHGPFTLQAAIAAVHSQASVPTETDWARIVELYGALFAAQPSPVVELNRAVAVAMGDSLEAGLALIDDLLARGDLRDYHLAHAARADLCRRLGRREDARAAYARALSLARQEPERRFIQMRLASLT